ncbi:hypothetical protein [Pseudomonas sp.]|uniref:hypothetical protein n=1 Tax=Pseudomonas sp. TaxID=306 RepID=UPI002E3039C3|nr:hypothetical protein [Pseudomonas sp.]HEX4547970.1 hypothetical protein [Pseudomonas sp.]
MQGQTETSEQIEIRKVNGSFEVHWDYQKTLNILAQRTRCERLDGYIDGFIDGAFVALEIPATNIHRTCSSKGSVVGIQSRAAIRLAKILADIFHPLVTAEHKKFRVSARLRYLRGRAAHLEGMGTFKEARG